MKPEKLRLVVSDIDNTLVVKHHALTKKAKEVIRKLRKRHIVFGLASGRSLAEVRRLLHRWGLEDVDMLICMNGSTLWDNLTKEEETYYELKKEWIREIIEKMSVFSCNPVIYRNDCIYCKEMDEVVKQSATSAEMEAMEVMDMKVFYQEENAKIMFRVNEEDMLQIEAYLTAHPSKDYHFFKTQSTLMEFSHRRVSKAYALKKFCEKHQISTAEVMAFGDTTNDHTMLEPSGVGVCLKNGSDDTKAIAGIITDYPCDEDGWERFMEMYAE